ncbi:TerB N-terminal domain-containing protein [Shewanella algidipiscicola]|uniref:Plasma membrane H+-transporting two-sector ATPase C subunit n=1 Tax=Shewanella algidipiscicola TaxID=614070 RepID=A0ABQ4PIZ1_9GAMM|nr:TerB N-terminal domain-containing protein [Shewanella algidipiscicola]GIU47602.1 plasma membrane H+-transporting two-sector ATPase C subunit [Shewanella algidipiscicola]
MEFIIGLFVIYLIYRLFKGNSKPSAHKPSPKRTPKPFSEKAKVPENRTSSPSIAVRSSSISVSSKSNHTYLDDDDDDFATFTIHTSFGREPEKTTNKQKGRWISEDEQLSVNGRQLTKGFFYFGGVMNSLDGYGIEPSLVDDKRPASSPSVDSEIYTDESLGYWPTYASLSKGCRGAYLDWLASDRSNPNTPIGYVFIYFYGFERRVIENKSNNQITDEEYIAIFEEVLRLNSVFNANRSFRGYSANFLELMALQRPTLLEDRLADIPETNNALSFKVNLATTIANGNPVTAPLALEWLKNTFEYSLKTPARRCEEEFSQLFQIRFSDKFGEGISVKPNKTKLRLSYHAASNGVHGVDLELGDLPDPSILKGPIKKLIPIAEQCTEELNSYSRYLGKADTSRSDIAALMLLPKELANEANSPVIETFKSWANQIISSNEGLTTVKDFWTHTGTPLPKAFNKKENELVANLAAKAEIGIAPDQRFHHAKLKIDDNIVLFSPGHGEFFEPSSAFNQVSLAIRLGAMVATIDGTVDQHEKLALQTLINHDDKLSPSEKNSLNAYLTWRLNAPVNNTGLKARIEKLGVPQVEFLKRFMLSIALADGKIDASEIKQIEKLYTSLGLDKSLVTSDIHAFASSKQPISATSKDASIDKSTFQLDEGILAMHESDTNDAKSMLESIFAVDEEAELEVSPTADVNEEGLDSPYKELFETLIAKESWPRKEVHELCSKLNIMVDGALETINDWAYDKVDAPVLDDDGDIYVDLEIVEELKG